MELYTAELPNGAPRQVSHGEVPRSLRAGFIWSRDGSTIVFAKDRDGNEQHDLYAIDTSTGAVAQLTDTPQAQEIPVEFSPDDAWLTMLSNRDGQLNLYKLRPDGSEVTPLTRFENPVLDGGIWSPDGTKIAFSCNETPELKNQDIYIVNADGGGIKRVLQVRVGSKDRPARWLPDSRRLAFTTDAFGVNRPGVLDVETGEVSFYGEEGVDETATSVSRNGRYLLALRNKDATIRPVIYELATGKIRELNLPPGVAYGAEFVLDDTALLVTHTSATRRNELLLYDLGSDSYSVLIPAEYGSIDPSVFVPERYVTYRSFDGLEIPALLYVPRDIPAGERLPAIVIVHGGPTGQFFRSFDPYAQFLVDRGFVVLEPNIRGSTGYGVEFRDMNRYDWGGADLEDVAAGAEYLKSLPFVDPNRLGVFGGSYGGYMTLMQVVKKPDLWKAGVAWVGISDLLRLYEKSMEHFKYFLRWHLGDPEENAALWRERSAINYAENLKAKLLLVHGVNDPRCPVEQSRLFRDRLVELGYKEGRDFEYVELGEEGHGSSDIAHKVRTYTLLADFMDRNL
ncbi:S9 family peptidase [Candidatus Bipolaricaulota bacterium]|nr:S9 family peptidase [Candidatus Bipolaricaulota bacterium]